MVVSVYLLLFALVARLSTAYGLLARPPLREPCSLRFSIHIQMWYI